MRLLNTTTFQVENSGPRPDASAILSHRWLGDEIKLQEIHQYENELRSGRRPLSSPQVDKIRGACQIARSKGFKSLWMDTCCIDKTDAREYAEAINSMFAWYRESKLCITYLSDVRKPESGFTNGPDAFKSVTRKGPSLWFSRGWTLQELLAPRELEFYDMDWNYIGNKRQLAGAIAEITGIDARFLTGERHIAEACIAVKMSWMARRQTTFPEDMAYSMIGIFNINMPFVYGETGPRAFRRLQETLLASPFMDESLFAWKMPDLNAGRRCGVLMADWEPGQWGLLAGSPEWFRDSGDIHILSGRAAQSRNFRLNPKGLEAPIRKNVNKGGDVQGIKAVSMLLWLSIIGLPLGLIGLLMMRHTMNKKAKEDYAYTLNCFRRGPDGRSENIEVYLRPVLVSKIHLFGTRGGQIKGLTSKITPEIECTRIRCDEFGLTSKKIKDYGEGIVFQPQPAY
ncbi:hypothetical protein GGR57DRAFT_483674 [Xylariaceae sp. FL1272]|nr:hypothetical protein GGR57DRAFT_483674 [Xylariaceae sp. FL1272]